MLDKCPLLATINNPYDLKKLSIEELTQLADELRHFLVNTVSKTSGHLASGLGVVDLTIALHYVYDTPNDQVIWDVGHQAYPHKILTGRRDLMQTIRQSGGLHPFLWRSESVYDVFSTGHASTSISEALGIAIANRKLNNNKKVVAVIGDGALTGGVAFEAMNHAGDLGEDMLIILNDNDMSISESVGGVSKYLSLLSSNPTYAKYVAQGKEYLKNFPILKDLALKTQEHLKGMILPGTFFEELGFNYVGPIDGHDIEHLISVLKNMRELKGPQILHIATKKGKGYEPAEEDPTKYHGVPKFDIPYGVKDNSKFSGVSFSNTFGKWLLDIAPRNEKMVAITPAMCQGSGMNEFAQKYSDRYFDVAIAEQHSLLLASGLAAGGLKPVVCVYSTFLQRAYDQIVHDIAIQDLPIVVAIDRAGIVGQDGPTHQGLFDISFIKSVPNITFWTPATVNEMYLMLNSAIKKEHPMFIRYPRGGSFIDHEVLLDEDVLFTEIEQDYNKAQIIKQGETVAILVFGPLVYDVLNASKHLNKNFTIVNMRSIKPFDKEMVIRIVQEHKAVITLEDGMKQGGIGEEISAFIKQELPNSKVIVKNLGVPDEFVEQGLPSEIYKHYGMDGVSVIGLASNLVEELQN